MAHTDRMKQHGAGVAAQKSMDFIVTSQYAPRHTAIQSPVQQAQPASQLPRPESPKPVQARPESQMVAVVSPPNEKSKPDRAPHALAAHAPNARTSRSNVLNRQLVAQALNANKKGWKARLFSNNAKANTMFAAAVMLIIFGGWVGFMGLRTNHLVEAQVKGLTQSGETMPDETVPDRNTFGSYVVDPSLPRFIRIAETDTYARIKRVGMDANNQLQTPMSTHDAGWYENSAKPGDPGGAMLIDGHVGFLRDGIFAKLKTLSNGDRIEIERGDGKKFTYKIVDSQIYDADKVDMARAMVSADTSKPGLNIITCTGQLTKDGTNYEQRLVVFAVAAD